VVENKLLCVISMGVVRLENIKKEHYIIT